MTASINRRRTMRRMLALVPLLAATLAACDGTSEPSGVDGRYSVYSVNGHRPPLAVRGDPSGAVVQVVDARLELDAPNATVELETRMMANGTAGETTTTTYTGTYSAAGDVLAFGALSTGENGVRIGAQGVVISPREVAVTLHIPGPSYQGFSTYPVALILRR